MEVETTIIDLHRASTHDCNARSRAKQKEAKCAAERRIREREAKASNGIDPPTSSSTSMATSALTPMMTRRAPPRCRRRQQRRGRWAPPRCRRRQRRRVRRVTGGTLKDGYVRNVPLPRVPQRQSASHMTGHELIAPKARIPIPGYLHIPSWIPTLPKLGSILGFSQRLL